MKLKAGEIAEALGGQLIGNPQQEFVYYTFDSRLMKEGGLFFALKGARDGHEFARDAVERGAKGIVCERELELDAVQIIVKDTAQALRKLAAWSLNLSPARRIGITGSAGKTTTKEFVARLLEGDYRVEKTPGNWNNLIGVPVFLLNRDEASQVLVIEMGISQPGEMDELVEVARPETGLFTRLYEVHTEFLGSLEGVIREKEKMLRHASQGCFNADDPNQQGIEERFKGEKAFYSAGGRDADVRLAGWKRLGPAKLLVDVDVCGKGIQAEFHFWSPVFIENLLAALSVTKFCPASNLRDKIASFRPLKGRGLAWERDGVFIIDESYNSNPSALLRSLAALATLEGRKIAVLSDMLELGEREKEEHLRVARAAADLRLDYYILTGPLMKEAARELARKRSNVYWFEDRWELHRFLRNLVKKGDILFFKGSNGTKLWEVVEEWR